MLNNEDIIDMRTFAMAVGLVVAVTLPNLALAQGPGQSSIESAEVGEALETRVDGYRMLVIAAGAVGGAMVTNVIVGGVFSPAMMGGAAASGTLLTLARGGVVAAGSVAGGYLGDWYYSK